MTTIAMIYTAEEWLTRDLRTDESQVVIGSPEEPIIRAGTKNVIEAPEKSFKTTFMLRFALGLSCGKTVFPDLPVLKKRKVLYLHGELTPQEIRERTRAASVGLPRPLDMLFQGWDINMHFTHAPGKDAIIEAIRTYRPEDVVFDPWQAFISGLDENGFKDISEALHFLDELIRDCGVTVYLVTHLGKDHTRGTRGHSCMTGWRDTLIALTRDRKDNTIRVTVEPRWATPPDPFYLKFDKGTLWPTNHFTGPDGEDKALCSRTRRKPHQRGRESCDGVSKRRGGAEGNETC